MEIRLESERWEEEERSENEFISFSYRRGSIIDLLHNVEIAVNDIRRVFHFVFNTRRRKRGIAKGRKNDGTWSCCCFAESNLDKGRTQIEGNTKYIEQSTKWCYLSPAERKTTPFTRYSTTSNLSILHLPHFDRLLSFRSFRVRKTFSAFVFFVYFVL